MGNNSRVSQKKNSAVPDIASQGIVKIEGLHGGFPLSSEREILPRHSAKYLLRVDCPASAAHQPPSMRSPPKVTRTAPASSRATPTDSATENHASRRPTVRSMTAKVEMQGM
jgi:hypothetical protein